MKIPFITNFYKNIKYNLGEFYRRAYPFSKEFMVKIIAYERPKKK